MPFLSICPNIRRQGDSVIVSSAWMAKILMLGSAGRRLTIDAEREMLTIKSRSFWLVVRTREISFNQVAAVTYGYQDMSPDAWLSHAHDSFDWFQVGIRLKGGKEIKLFNFLGEGTFANNGPLPDWLYWGEKVFDRAGVQQKESRFLVDLMANLVNVEVVPPRD